MALKHNIITRDNVSDWEGGFFPGVYFLATSAGLGSFESVAARNKRENLNARIVDCLVRSRASK